MSSIIEPFKCDDSQLKLGVSCDTQKEIWNNLNKLMSGNFQLPIGSVAVGSGLGDASWNEALNYEKDQKALSEKLSEEAKQKSESNIAPLVDKNKNKDLYLYAIAFLLVSGVLIYEFKNKK
jgi:hypothetical protein